MLASLRPLLLLLPREGEEEARARWARAQL
jgi:hypothetical protein